VRFDACHVLLELTIQVPVRPRWTTAATAQLVNIRLHLVSLHVTIALPAPTNPLLARQRVLIALLVFTQLRAHHIAALVLRELTQVQQALQAAPVVEQALTRPMKWRNATIVLQGHTSPTQVLSPA